MTAVQELIFEYKCKVCANTRYNYDQLIGALLLAGFSRESIHRMWEEGMEGDLYP